MPPEPREPFTIGVEEEYHLLDAETFALRPRADRVLPTARAKLGERVTAEINLSQAEVSTPICETLDDARRHLSHLRTTLAAAALEHDTLIAASGTHPFSEWLGQPITPGLRYEGLEEDYQQLAREQLVCGCHVHVAVPDRDTAVHVMNRTRPWLAVLLALSANSPFWQGINTGYASYRWPLFRRWPMTGAPPPLDSAAAYDAMVDSLVRTGSISDASYLYWDIRPSTRYATVEFRVADVCTSVDDAVLLAALCRSLVRTAVGAGDAPMDHPSHEVLQAAAWRAARYGLGGELVDVAAGASRPAAHVVRSLLAHLRADLEDHGEWDEVSGGVERILADGNGADRQCRVYEETGDLVAVARMVTDLTLTGIHLRG